MNDHPVLLVHGLASSFEHGWRATGWADILTGEGRQVIGMDLPGHGTNSAQDPAEVSPAAAVLAAVGDHAQVDAVGFSAGGHAVLAAAAAAPRRFRRIAVLGVGEPGTRPDDRAARILAGLSLTRSRTTRWRALSALAASAGNDRRTVARYLRAPHPAVSLADLAVIDMPVLVVLGDRDFAGPAGQLLAAMPGTRLVTLRGVDHFGAPSDYGCIEAVMRFLAG